MGQPSETYGSMHGCETTSQRGKREPVVGESEELEITQEAPQPVPTNSVEHVPMTLRIDGNKSGHRNVSKMIARDVQDVQAGLYGSQMLGALSP